MNSQKHILAINTLTNLEKVDWCSVKTAFGVPVDVRVERLPLFGLYFRSGNIEEALQYAEPIVKARIEKERPDLLLVHSKGVSLITYLSFKGIWDGAVVLLSPIPNACDHLSLFVRDHGGDEQDDEWDREWYSTLQILGKHKGKISVGFGDTVDEQTFVESYVAKTAKEKGWLLRKVKGDHDWLEDCKSLASIADLIYFAMESSTEWVEMERNH